ncbi:integration host factor subunit beta [Dyadobacter luteus]|uniref:Integration host factor subunit beta n=1 Tax=Dyadobacter luteus TaxID=2259619 RepID=A0A3D8YGN1_9BACT|nr:HU family DNA-binding protein [Dyadobacter luteus]REA63803.1 integration host factor subunit beta [Dyadobacter luteus]
MTKADVVSKITSKTGLNKEDAESVLESFFVTIKEALAEGENVYFRGFGSFITKQRAEKTARNITKNTTMIVPAHIIPHFKPSDEFVHQVKQRQLHTA